MDVLFRDQMGIGFISVLVNINSRKVNCYSLVEMPVVEPVNFQHAPVIRVAL